LQWVALLLLDAARVFGRAHAFGQIVALAALAELATAHAFGGGPVAVVARLARVPKWTARGLFAFVVRVAHARHAILVAWIAHCLAANQTTFQAVLAVHVGGASVVAGVAQVEFAPMVTVADALAALWYIARRVKLLAPRLASFGGVLTVTSGWARVAGWVAVIQDALKVGIAASWTTVGERAGSILSLAGCVCALPVDARAHRQCAREAGLACVGGVGAERHALLHTVARVARVGGTACGAPCLDAAFLQTLH
jgi:hypothetical protein